MIDGAAAPVLASGLIAPPFRHGFSMRAGGVSPPPWDSLNLGQRSGDAAPNVEENWRRLVQAVGAKSVHRTRQVHGAGVAVVRADDDPERTAAIDADALITNVPDVALAVRVADCVPLLIVDPGTGAVAAVHAGWRGTAAGVAPAAVNAMVENYGSNPGNLQAVIGPSIGPCCFEVGREVLDVLRRHVPDTAELVREMPGRKPHVDLWAANRALLQQAGVTRIDVLGACTRCDAERFFSYRRFGVGTGQQAGIVVRRGS